MNIGSFYKDIDSYCCEVDYRFGGCQNEHTGKLRYDIGWIGNFFTSMVTRK